MKRHNPKYIVSIEVLDFRKDTVFEYKPEHKYFFGLFTEKEQINKIHKPSYIYKQDSLPDECERRGNEIWYKPRVIISFIDGSYVKKHFNTCGEALEYATYKENAAGGKFIKE